jgi:hypothetical protein
MEEITGEAVELVARVAALDIGKASLVACAGAARDQTGRPTAGGPHVRGDHPGAAGVAGLAGLSAAELVRDGGRLDVLEAAVLPARGRHRVLTGERPRREERAGPAEDRPAGCGVVVQAG